MNTAHERCETSTNEWYTPPSIIHSLGSFDLDPCSSDSAHRLNRSAPKYYTERDNGLILKWEGRVWLNPPYSTGLISAFVKRLAEHGNGIALLYNRLDAAWFQSYVLDVADSIFFFRKRIHFLRPDGTAGNQPGSGSCLISYGEYNTKLLKNRD